MDDFYLNLAVYRFQDMIAEVAGPDYPIRFEYGRPKKGHNWHHTDWAGVVREVADHVRKTAPEGAPVASWNYRGEGDERQANGTDDARRSGLRGGRGDPRGDGHGRRGGAGRRVRRDQRQAPEHRQACRQISPGARQFG